jgi:hypothetical protein
MRANTSVRFAWVLSAALLSLCGCAKGVAANTGVSSASAGTGVTAAAGNSGAAGSGMAGVGSAGANSDNNVNIDAGTAGVGGSGMGAAGVGAAGIFGFPAPADAGAADVGDGGMCANLACFDVFDCALYHPNEYGPCKITKCEALICKP